MSRPRLAILRDYLEEQWPSMDLCADMLLAQSGPLEAVGVCPEFRRRLRMVPWLGRTRLAYNADRLINRFVFYPRFVRTVRESYEAFHVVDHSYAQLVHDLPLERTGVFCHDLDTFRCLLEPQRDRRPRWFRALARRTLAGLQKAAVVFHTTGEVREEILRHSLIDPNRLVQAPLGVAGEFTPGPVECPEAPFVLHVGSCIPRKRMDVLLDTFAGLREIIPALRLVKVGGPWTPAQQEQIGRLGIGSAIEQVIGLTRQQIAELYRRSAVVLVPSDGEGFGLPVIEALACGALVVASDLPVLREVAGEAAVFCPVADVPSWVTTVSNLLARPESGPKVETRLTRAGRYTWGEHARIIHEAYQRLLS